MVTAYVTDSRFDSHNLPGHPERAERLLALRERLDQEHLTERLLRLDLYCASDEVLRAVHHPAYLTQLEKTASYDRVTMLGLDTYVTPQSYEIARLAAGAVLRTADAVMEGEADNALVAVRPPGHHATPTAGMGFCLLNNVAIAARYVQREYDIERVLIVDYDVHHGNGTQDTFYTDPSVLYISTHQAPLYPGTGALQDIGEGRGTGYTLNIPLPPGVGDRGYADVFAQVVQPAAARFQPQLILVSIGFDAHWADPLANMTLSLMGYDHVARALIAMAGQLCAGRIIFVLEGGYNLQTLSYGWANLAYALSGDSTAKDPLGAAFDQDEPIIDRLVGQLKQQHKLD